jgi:HEAT repeat protein
MTKHFPIGAGAAVAAALLVAAAAWASASEASTEHAWLILQEGLTSKRAVKRTNAVHALRILVHNSRAQDMAEQALADPDPKVRASAARALGPMDSVSSQPKLKALLNDKEPFVVLAAAHSLFLLGDRDEAYDIDYEVLNGERKSADGFVASQISELRDPKAVAAMGLETGIGFMPFGGEAYEVYKRVRKDDVTPVRVAAAKELIADRDPKVDAALTKACSDRNWSVRAAAVFAIAKRGNPSLLNVITLLMGDKSQTVRYEAAAAVLRLTGAASPN